MALIEEPSAKIAVLTLACPDGKFPSVGALASAGDPARARHPRPLRARSRSARPTRGPGSISASGACASRSAPATKRRKAPAPYAFLPAEGEGLHQIPVGPVHAGIIEPGHFRFTANGETVVRLEERLGYVHKGIEGLMAGATLDSARAARRPRLGRQHRRLCLRLRARRRGGARHRGAAARAIWLRALMAELERLANHFGDIGAICNDASFSLMHAHCGILRERVLRAAQTLLRPSADDGPRRAGRRRATISQPTALAQSRAL